MCILDSYDYMLLLDFLKTEMPMKLMHCKNIKLNIFNIKNKRIYDVHTSTEIFCVICCECNQIIIVESVTFRFMFIVDSLHFIKNV